MHFLNNDCYNIMHNAVYCNYVNVVIDLIKIYKMDMKYTYI